MGAFWDTLYEQHGTPIAQLLGERYERQTFTAWADRRIGFLPKSPEDGDGQAVEIWEQRAPARFLTLRALEGKNSIGGLKPAWELGFGSCSEQLEQTVYRLAVLVTEGMVCFHVPSHQRKEDGE